MKRTNDKTTVVSAHKAKTLMGKATCTMLGVPVVLTRAGHLSSETAKALNRKGYYWFPGRRTWSKLD